LVALLQGHPQAELVTVCAAGSAGERWESLYPNRGHLYQGEIQPFDPDRLAGLDVVFLALPHGASAAAARELHGRVERIIDLSGDLRLANADEYRHWYGLEHAAPELLGVAVYGLPELFGATLPGADLIACAGCYATVSQLAAAPALALPGVTSGNVHISAASGTSGAGRKTEIALSFSEVFGDLRAYRVGKHQHTPEIAAGLESYSNRPVRVTFVPHLAPIERGIAATVVLHCEELPEQADLLAVYDKTYAASPFVRVHDPEELLPAVRHVAGTNFCALAPVVDHNGSSIVVIGVIDNLLKGAAGQAVQVFNIAAGLPETTGLQCEPTEGRSS
jgi:N-acetyl-gamma-glutamyl-phosphate reductase